MKERKNANKQTEENRTNGTQNNTKNIKQNEYFGNVFRIWPRHKPTLRPLKTQVIFFYNFQTAFITGY